MQLQAARETISSHLSRETTDHFDVALHSAAVTDIESMTELRSAVGDCVSALKSADVGPVQMILAMKVCAIDSVKRYSPNGDDYPASNVDFLIDQIVRWAIIEYYKAVS